MRNAPTTPLTLSLLSLFCIVNSCKEHTPPSANEAVIVLPSEAIGTLRPGMSLQAALKSIGPGFSPGPKTNWGDDGLFRQPWKSIRLGLEIDAVSETENGAQAIVSITATAPSRLDTARGIHVGSTRKQVETAYAKEIEEGVETDSSPRDQDMILISTEQGDMLFDFKKDSVARIFLGDSGD